MPMSIVSSAKQLEDNRGPITESLFTMTIMVRMRVWPPFYLKFPTLDVREVPHRVYNGIWGISHLSLRVAQCTPAPWQS